ARSEVRAIADHHLSEDEAAIQPVDPDLPWLADRARGTGRQRLLSRCDTDRPPMQGARGGAVTTGVAVGEHEIGEVPRGEPERGGDGAVAQPAEGGTRR